MLIAKMYECDTISDLKREIIDYMNDEGISGDEEGKSGGICPVFDIRSAYPPRRLGDDMSLQESGLCPNGTVHAQKM